MRKWLLTIVLLCAALTGRAQENAAYLPHTLYGSLGVGGAMYMPSGNNAFGPDFSLSIGRWLMKPLAFQISAEVAMAAPYRAPDAGQALYFMGSAEFLWDVNATFFHVYNKALPYPVPFYPMIGLGGLYQSAGDGFSADRDFQAMLGLHLPVRIAPKLALYFELKNYFLPYSFDGSDGANFMPTFNIGITKRWYDSPFGRKTGFEARNTSEDWFSGYGVGILFNSFEFEQVGNWDSKLYNITGDLMVGRNYSDIWTIRFELSGFFARGRYNTETESPGHWYTFNSLHTDFMINLSHLANFNRGRRWNFLPYLGAGPVWRYQRPVFTLGADAGLMARRYIDNLGDFFVDLKYIMVPPRVAGGVGPSGSPFGVGYAMLTVGYIGNYGHSTTRYRVPVGYSNCD